MSLHPHEPSGLMSCNLVAAVLVTFTVKHFVVLAI